uniref:DNA polymerase n=1 Tax=Anatid alphaherpesvirus 2 TaxID=3080522 RepID=A0AAU0K7X8_9ALPH
MDGRTAESFHNPLLAYRRGFVGNPRHGGSHGGERRPKQRGHSYVTEMEEFKFIAPKCLDEPSGDGGSDGERPAPAKGTHVGTLRRSPIVYRDGEVYEFLKFKDSAALWPRRTCVWGGESFRELDFDPRFTRFHVYDMVENVEHADSAAERDGHRFLDLIRPMGTVVTMFGMTDCGKRVAVHVYGVCPYFYMRKADADAACGSRGPRDLAEKMAASLRSSVTGAAAGKRYFGSGARFASTDCFEVDVVRRTDVYYFGTETCDYYRIKSRSGRFVTALCDNFCPSVTKYEGSVDAITRMVLDNAGFVTFGWYGLKTGARGERIQVRRPEHHTTSCDVEVNCTVDNLVGEPNAGAWPDYKLMCFDIECKAGGENETAFPIATNEKDLVIQISCLAYSLATHRLEHVILFSLGSCDLPEACVESILETYSVEPVVLEFESEYELLLAFVTFVKQYAPEFATGYNIVNFDWAYIYNKLTSVYGAHLDGYGVLNRGGTFKIWDAGINRFQKKSKVKINGLVSLDMYTVATEKLKLPSYKLDAVAEAVLGERKKDLSYKEIPGFFASGPEKRGEVGEYCIQDSLLVGKLFFKYLPHLELSAVAKLAGILLPRAIFDGQQMRVFTCLLRLAGSRGYVLPDNTRRFTDQGADDAADIAGDFHQDASEGDEDDAPDAAALEPDEAGGCRQAGTSGSSGKGGSGRAVGYQGAKVLEPTSGFHVSPVVVFDFASLYPSIIQAHNLCFTTLAVDGAAVAGLKEGDDFLTIEVLGRVLRFVKSHVRESLLSVLLKDWLAMRKAIRAKMQTSSEEEAVLLDKQQAAIKVVCNSVYGFCGVANGLLPCLDVAATVTTIGRNMLLSVRDYIHVRWGSAESLVGEFPELAQAIAAGGEGRYSVSVIYGDTDSVFVKFTGVGIDGLVAAGDAMAKRVSGDLFLPPIKLECEKTFDKLLLITKKKYMGTIYRGKMMMKGVDLVRKNNCRFINSYAKRLADLLFGDDAVAAAAAEVAASPPAMWLERPLPEGMKPFGDVLVEAYNKIAGTGDALNVGEFVMSAELSRPPDAYANKRIAHLTVYYKLCMRADQTPMVKDRISYVIAAPTEEVERDADRVAEMRGDKRTAPADAPVAVDGPEDAPPGTKRRGACQASRAPKRRKLLVSEMAEDPTYLASRGASLNIDYYFTHLLGTLSVTFKALFGNDTKITEAILRRFIPERHADGAEEAARLASAGFSVARLGGAASSRDEEEESRQTLSRAFRILTEARRRC